MATATRSANSREKKYRRGARVCPQCNAATIIRSKFPKENPKWWCDKRNGGCGQEFEGDDPSILEQAPTIDPLSAADLVNTLEGMAAKRALVAAVRLATNASDLFADDDPEPGDDDTERDRRRARASRARGRSTRHSGRLSRVGWTITGSAFACSSRTSASASRGNCRWARNPRLSSWRTTAIPLGARRGPQRRPGQRPVTQPARTTTRHRVSREECRRTAGPCDGRANRTDRGGTGTRRHRGQRARRAIESATTSGNRLTCFPHRPRPSLSSCATCRPLADRQASPDALVRPAQRSKLVSILAAVAVPL